jgi:hypothetical protein
MSRWKQEARRAGRRYAFVVVILAAFLALAIAADPAGKPAASGEPGKGRFAEPRTAPDRLEAGAWAGSPVPRGPRSEVVARQVERLRREPGPPDEVYALVMVTDRATGDREMFARGVPDPRIPEYLEDIRNAPPGLAYFETEGASADAEVEIVVRSVHVRERKAGPLDPTPEEEEEFDLRERNGGSGLSHRLEAGLRGRIAAGEVDLAGGALVPVAVEMRGVPRLRLPKPHDPAAGGLAWAGMELAAARERAIIARKIDVASRQRPLVQAIERAGGKVTYAAWSSGAVEADVPARALAALAEHPAVFSIEYREPQVEYSHYHGEDYYPAFDADDYNPWHAGLNGVSAKHSYSSRIVLALGEQCIDQGNPAYLTAGGSWDRAWYYDCDPSGVCTQWGVEACSGTNSHATRVSQMMAGDFMDGQDPLVSNPRRYTGTCEECRFFFLQDQNLDQRTKPLDAACDLGVDIFESSIGSTTISCDGNGSYDGTLQSLIDCDAIYVQSAGNYGSTGGCSTGYPADHPWTFAVGGIASLSDCTTSGDYYTSACEYDTGASRGGGSYDSGTGTASIIDQAAPYHVGNAIIPGTRNPVTFTTTQGTSFSAPLVAGLMARYLDWWHQHVSNSLFYNNRMRNYFLLFGDRSFGSAGTSRTSSGYSIYWGSGRTGLIPFDDKAEWAIRRTSCELGANDSCTFTDGLDPDLEFYKAVVWHDGKNYSNEPGIELTLNPAGCGNATRSLTRYDSKTMLVYSADVSAGELNGCTSITITIGNDKVGTSGTRRFHYGAYAETEDERNF